LKASIADLLERIHTGCGKNGDGVDLLRFLQQKGAFVSFFLFEQLFCQLMAENDQSSFLQTFVFV
jgi:hypothetical protein